MQIGTLWLNWSFLTLIVTLGCDNLSLNKTTAQIDIASTCATCVSKYAVDGEINTCMRTKDISTSTEGNNHKHTTWWYVDLGGVFNLYNIRIQFKDYEGYNMRQRGRFAGFSLYVSNTNDSHDRFLCYKNGPELPSLNFTTSCITHGRYVTFYNERLHGVTYPVGYENANVVTELCEVVVNGCFHAGVYGEQCNKHCPDNCQEQRCYFINGTCLGCKSGWKGTYCNETCSNGYYGVECMAKCVGQCKDNEPCNHTSGLCDNGCDDGWTGDNCTNGCSAGTYGPSCIHDCSGHCLNNSICNRTTGECDIGCESGYTGIRCDKGCNNGTFGTNCVEQCGHCMRNMPCNSTHGHCNNGCSPGYLGKFCNKTCASGTYGPHCKLNCSSNCDTGLCNNVNGACICEHEMIGSFRCPETLGNVEKSETKSLTIEIGAGAGSGVFLLLIIGLVLYIIWHRRNKSNTSDESTETIIFSSSDESLMKSKQTQAQKTGTQNGICDAEKRKSFTPEKSNNLNTLINTLSEIKSNQMGKEYKTIPKGELHPCVTGKREDNLSKNRYTTIFPYDHSRVVLDTSTNEPDYINANYIKDVFGKKTYLATQGPKNSTIADFWRMVWQEHAGVIVCLTNLSESKTKKCAKYWPDLNDKHMEGDISIRCLKEQTYAENIIRHLRISKRTDKTERDVFMFHYTQWPDHGVPEPLSLVVFHRHVMKTVEEHPMGYIVVHCSAGIGRTGTFIALDALYREGERTGKVNIPQYVEKMRNDRMNMIQGEDQYKTVYMALLEAFRGRLRAVPVDFFLKEFQDHSCYLNHGDVSKKSPFALEFEELLSFRKGYTHKDFKSGMSNISANYVPSVLPVERYLCPLTNATESLYYNAVCLQSFTQCDRFISAQFPLPDYIENFLTLVKTYYACTIVSLYPLEEVKSTSLWLPTKNQQKTVGLYTIKMAESTQTKYVAKTYITLQQKGGSSIRVAVLQCKGWEDEYDSKSTCRRILIDLVQEAKIEERTHPNGRILVLTSDGAKRCGPFCAVFNALEQMMMDEEVDLFTITRQLQTRRPEFLSSLEEYQFCFDTISDYLQNDTLYANV